MLLNPLLNSKVLSSLTRLRPIHAMWDLNPEYPHYCLNDGAAVFSASLVNICTDLLCTVMPMPLIWNLKLPTRQRLAVISIFGLGILVNVAGSVRTAYVYESMLATYDVTWMGWPILLSATIEINLGLICASAPALRPLLTAVLPRLLQTTRNYASSSSKRASKFWSPVPSKPSQVASSQVQPDLESQDPSRMGVVRTVEMETWSEAMNKTISVPHAYDVEATHKNAPTFMDTVNLKSGEVVRTHASVPSSSSGSTTQGGSQPRSPLTKEFQ